MVTTILHYLFLTVFFWILCEGIIILVKFLRTVYHGIFQSIYFFFVLGWGKNILFYCTVKSRQTVVCHAQRKPLHHNSVLLYRKKGCTICMYI